LRIKNPCRATANPFTPFYKEIIGQPTYFFSKNIGNQKEISKIDPKRAMKDNASNQEKRSY